jgi:hypothetical protein
MVSSSSTAASAWNRSAAAPEGLVSANVAWLRASSSLSSPASASACSHQRATVASPLSQDAIDAASSSASTRAGPGGVASTAPASSSRAAAGSPRRKRYRAASTVRRSRSGSLVSVRLSASWASSAAASMLPRRRACRVAESRAAATAGDGSREPSAACRARSSGSVTILASRSCSARRAARLSSAYGIDAISGCVKRTRSPSTSTTPAVTASARHRTAAAASPTAAATAVTVGCASAAVSSNASRVCGASPQSRSVTRTLKSAGTGSGSDAENLVPRRCSARAISRHIIGFPPVGWCSRVSTGRASGSRSRAWMIRCIMPTLTGPTTSRSPGRPRSDGTSLAAPVRQDVTSRTGSRSSRRSAKERTLRELISSHWTSSMASRSGPDRARARSTPRTATPTTRLPGSRSPSPEMSRAADSARCWTAGRAASSDGSSPSKRSPRPAKDKAASDWLHRQVRTETPAACASSRACAQIAVLPMPASPARVSDDRPMDGIHKAASARWRHGPAVQCPR